MTKEKEEEKEKEKEKEEASAKEGKEAEKAEGEDGEEELVPKKKKLDKNIIILIAAAVIALAGLGGGAAFYFMAGSHEAESTEAVTEGEHGAINAKSSKAAKAEKSGHGGEKKAAGEGGGAEGSFFALGDLLVNLSGEGKRPNYLKVKISLEVADPADLPSLEAMKPRIIDNFQIYLRELRVEDLRGSAGLYRLREALLLRVTEAVQPIRIRDVLFQEMLVQ